MFALSVQGRSAGCWSSEAALCWGIIRQNRTLVIKTRARLHVVLHGHNLALVWGCCLWGSPQRDKAAVFLQAELIVGDQSGAIHIWDLKTDHNEQLIPEPEVSVNSVHIDPDASYMAAVNSSVSSNGLKRGMGFTVLRQLLGCASHGQRQMICTYALPAALLCCGQTWKVRAAFGWLITSPATHPPVSPQGNCYVWNLTGGIGEEVTQLIPKTKIPAHNRYALQCKFSPDST